MRPRAGHVAVLDEKRDGMWLHGGYTTFFPYLLSTGTGSGYGTQSASSSTGGSLILSRRVGGARRCCFPGVELPVNHREVTCMARR